jgi:hypothetical protein
MSLGQAEPRPLENVRKVIILVARDRLSPRPYASAAAHCFHQSFEKATRRCCGGLTWMREGDRDAEGHGSYFAAL